MAIAWCTYQCQRCHGLVSLPRLWAVYRHSPALRCYDCRGRLRLVQPVPRPLRRRHRRAS
jgi:predicted SprT family Zn-dependent metalloprotease